MPEKVTYYAIVNDFSSLEEPGGVLRRIKVDGGERDETFGSDLKWGRSALLYSYERGDLTNDMVPISTLNSCGSSSSEYLRRNRPTDVTRSSDGLFTST